MYLRQLKTHKWNIGRQSNLSEYENHRKNI